MKKSLVLAAIATMILSQSISYAATTPAADQQPNVKTEQTKVCPKKMPERPKLDDRLNLTEEQRQKAHEIRMKGHEQIKPVFDEKLVYQSKEPYKEGVKLVVSQNYLVCLILVGIITGFTFIAVMKDKNNSCIAGLLMNIYKYLKGQKYFKYVVKEKGTNEYVR